MAPRTRALAGQVVIQGGLCEGPPTGQHGCVPLGRTNLLGGLGVSRWVELHLGQDVPLPPLQLLLEGCFSSPNTIHGHCEFSRTHSRPSRSHTTGRQPRQRAGVLKKSAVILQGVREASRSGVLTHVWSSRPSYTATQRQRVLAILCVQCEGWLVCCISRSLGP